MTTLTEPGTVTARRSRRLMWAILGLVLLADALDVIDATVTNIAAPTIAGELNGGKSLIKWLGPGGSPWRRRSPGSHLTRPCRSRRRET
jgi:hypothetical protein